jgi:hypothetical protein
LRRDYFVSGARFALWSDKEVDATYHLIEFKSAFTADLEISPRHRLERLRIQKGMRAYVCLRPYVVETAGELDEVADLFFEDSTVTRQVPFERFRFVE